MRRRCSSGPVADCESAVRPIGRRGQRLRAPTMKVLLTGASGFVGSHLLDALRARAIATVLCLRPSSDRRWLESHLSAVETRLGTLTDPSGLDDALRDVTHVVHCAGATKSLRAADFFQANQLATRAVVEAVNRRSSQIQRLLVVSSLAAAGPGLPDAPVREGDAPRPVSVYGRSKLAAEQEVREHCRIPFVILRPAAVYGPRDTEFLRLFRTVRAGWLPLFGGGRQPLNLVFVRDLAAVVVEALTHPAAERETFFVAHPQPTTSGELAREIAYQLGVRPRAMRLPVAALWPVCALAELSAQITRRPGVVSLHKFAELRAPGWVCDVTKLARLLGLTCATPLPAGVAETIAWYRQQSWLR